MNAVLKKQIEDFLEYIEKKPTIKIREKTTPLLNNKTKKQYGEKKEYQSLYWCPRSENWVKTFLNKRMFDNPLSAVNWAYECATEANTVWRHTVHKLKKQGQNPMDVIIVINDEPPYHRWSNAAIVWRKNK